MLLLYGNGSEQGPHQPGPDEPQEPMGRLRRIGFVSVNRPGSVPEIVCSEKYEAFVDDAGVFWTKLVK